VTSHTFYPVFANKFGQRYLGCVPATTLADARATARRDIRYFNRTPSRRHNAPTFLGVLECCGTVHICWYPKKGLQA
jgi:hypothetical protein